jgi:hypothetical protein
VNVFFTFPRTANIGYDEQKEPVSLQSLQQSFTVLCSPYILFDFGYNSCYDTAIITKCYIQNVTLPTTHELVHAQNDETNDSTEFSQPYPAVATHALLNIGKAANSAVLSLAEHLDIISSCFQKFCYQSVYRCLISVLPCQDTHG